MAQAFAIQPTVAARRNGRPGWIAGIVLATAIVATLYCLSPNFRFQSSPDASPYAGDFLQEWLGGYIVRAGDHSRFYDVRYAQALQHDPQLVGFQWDRRRYLPIVYPPFYYLALSPLSLLPLWVAAWVWALIMVSCLALAWLLMVQAKLSADGSMRLIVMARPRPRGDQPARLQTLLTWTLPLAVLYQPTLETLSSSQKGTVCLLILTSTYVLMKQNRPFWAGAVFGLLAFKPQLALVIAVSAVVKRQWDFVAGGAVCGLTLLALSLTLGQNVCWQYVQFGASAADYSSTAGYDLFDAPSLTGFCALLFGPATTLTRAATAGSSLVVIALLVLLLRGPVDVKSSRYDLQFSGLIVATLLLSPHLYSYDLVLLLLPFFLLSCLAFTTALDSCAPRPWIIGLMLALYVAPAIAPGLAHITHLQISTLLLGTLLFMLARASDERFSWPIGENTLVTLSPAASSTSSAV